MWRENWNIDKYIEEVWFVDGSSQSPMVGEALLVVKFELVVEVGSRNLVSGSKTGDVETWKHY